MKIAFLWQQRTLKIKNLMFIIVASIFLLGSCAYTTPRKTYYEHDQGLVADLNARIASLKEALLAGTISEKEYYDKAWGAYDEAATKSDSLELKELAAFDRWQSQRYLAGEISKEYYTYAVVAKQYELRRTAEEEIRKQQAASSQSTLNTLSTIYLLGTLLGPQSPIGPGPSRSSYCSGTVSGNVFSGNCQ